MSVRPCVVGATGRAVATATVALATLLGTPEPVRAAGNQWDAEQVPSVMVESGAVHGIPTLADGISSTLASDDGSVVSDGSMATDDAIPPGGGNSCTQCAGTGCVACRTHTIFDMFGRHCHDKNACWIGRADALLLWRNSPPDGAIVDGDPLMPDSGLIAGGMGSVPAAGPRFSIFRVNNCTGHAIEATYLRAANFRSIRQLGGMGPYELATPPIYGITVPAFDGAAADLGARLQSFEFNRHHCMTRNLRFLAGFRWIEWQEQFSMQTYSSGAAADYFQTNCFNDLYGGQIGLDAILLATQWIRFDSVVKAGAYYNVGTQSSLYTTTGGTAGTYASDSPLSGAFAGEVGLTGVIPLTCCLDLRVGYFGLWLSGIAQPTQQLASQVMPSPPDVAEGTINADGGVVVQGVSLGLEGRW